MADTTEMLRIIRHAADRLDQEDPAVNAFEVARLTISGTTETMAIVRGQSEALAMSYASVVLRMVAACMDEEPPKPAAAPASAPVARAEALRVGSFDPAALFAELDRQRVAREISWRQLAGEAGVSPSTLTRLGQGKRPDADGLVALLAWLGTTDLAPFLAVADG